MIYSSIWHIFPKWYKAPPAAVNSPEESTPPPKGVRRRTHRHCRELCAIPRQSPPPPPLPSIWTRGFVQDRHPWKSMACSLTWCQTQLCRSGGLIFLKLFKYGLIRRQLRDKLHSHFIGWSSHIWDLFIFLLFFCGQAERNDSGAKN